MAWQPETGASSARATDKQDLLNKLVSFATSRHVATVAINNGGTGGTYAVGDIVTLTHAGAHLDARFEVLTVSGGQILTMRIVASGAFGNRPNGSITISAGGTGYSNSITDLILELQSGSSRCPAKVKATTNGSGVVTSAVAFEDLGTAGLGVYSTLPSYPAATVIAGPNGTTAGSGCTITMGGSTGIIGTTDLAVTGGGGTGATVDITLAETGWSVDGRNTNDRNQNSILNEKEVVLVGDASGLTNKPFVAYITATMTSGLDTRHEIVTVGLIAHNPSLGLHEQDFRSPGITDATTLADGGSFILCSEDTGGGVDEQDFWFSVDDTRIVLVTQIEESAAVSDNGVYMQHYAGLMDRFGTETEAPYPMFIFGSSRAQNVDPKVGSTSITSLAEQRHTSTGPGWFYDHVVAVWRDIVNNDGGAVGAEAEVMLPIGRNFINTTSGHEVVVDGVLTINPDFFELDRSSAVLILRKIPGDVNPDRFFLWPLTIMRKPSGAVDSVQDRLFGQLRGVFWVSSDDGSGARITDFSEDYITIGSDRYRIFHNHVHTDAYQYIAVKEDV